MKLYKITHEILNMKFKGRLSFSVFQINFSLFTQCQQACQVQTDGEGCDQQQQTAVVEIRMMVTMVTRLHLSTNIGHYDSVSFGLITH